MVTIAQDKVEHFAFGFVLSFMGIFYFPLVWLGYGFAFGKELYDKYYGTGWNQTDIIATIVGALTAWGIVLVVT